MATITTAVYLEDAARTAGEAWTINGGELTIRTDSRWHANAPASLTGSLAAVTISSSLGGKYKIDGTTVRWMPYDTGIDLVPAIGTSITQGGVSGYLLGVWSAINVAPTAVGAAMPASGFIKFREVTGGAFTAGALGGISASATGPDVVGWIEVVHDQAVAITVPRLGVFQVRGDWFDLGLTSGVANQVIQLPTMGSTTSYIPGLWIANTDTPTTDEHYDFYPSIYVAAMIAANLGTDIRSKFVSMETNGSCRIGHNGTTAIGYLPPANRKIRIPNVFGRQCLTTTRATNAIPSATAGTRPDFTTTSAGYIDIEYFTTDWYLLFAQPYYVKLNHTATFDFINISECATALDIYDGGNGMSQTLDTRTVTLTSNFAGGRIEKWDCPRHAAGATDHAFEVLNCIGQTIKNCRSGIVTYTRNTGMAYQFNQSYNITLEDCVQFNSNTVFTTCYDSVVKNLNHVDRYVGATNATTGLYAISILAASNNILVDGVIFGFNNVIVNNHPYGGIINIGQSKNIKFRNFGSRAAILNGGSANQIGYVYVSGGNNQNVKGQRCYVQPTRSGILSSQNSDKNVTYEHFYGDFADALSFVDLNGLFKGGGATNTTTGQGSVYGTHIFDMFTSDTAGRVVVAFNEPTTETSSLVTLVAGTPQFTSAGNLVLNEVGDEVIMEMAYFALGHLTLSATAPTITGTNVTYSSGATWGNHNIYYQIDTGSGWNGTWKNFTGAILNGESITASTGFKLKFRFVCATASTTNLLTYVSLLTTSSLAAQRDNLYPLDTATLSLTGLKSGSEIRCYSGIDPATAVLLDGIESSGTSFVLTHSLSSIAGYIQIFALGYQPIKLDVTYTTSNVSIPIQQVIDRVYINN